MLDTIKIRTNRLVFTKSSKGRKKGHRHIREQYLRRDIPCRSELCTDNNCSLYAKDLDRPRVLPAGATHYVIPCDDVAGRYLEILENAEFVGLIFLQSVVSKVLHEMGKRVYKRICKKVRDPNAKSIYFPNEFNYYTYVERKTTETQDDWIVRNLYKASLWFYEHLLGKISIVLLTENPAVIERYQNSTVGVHVMMIGDYLTIFWPHLAHVADLYDSLSASWKAISVSDQAGYVEYLPTEVLMAGMESGKYWQGVLRVNKHNAQEEAFISSTGKFNKVQDIFIPGFKFRNRAIHGDTVVVELLPRNEWKKHEKKLQQDNTGGDSDELSGSDTDTMPTGRVVGVLQRSWRDYAASFPENEDGTSQRSSGEAILVIPYDYRIPKIRILTRQAESLRNDRIVVRIDSWNVNSQYPNGHFVQTLGEIGRLETEIATLLVEYEATGKDFPTKILSEMPDESWNVSTEEIEKRRDLRESHLVFSIDPQGCQDVDDCLSVRDLPNGNIELGVHIADVTHFVMPNSATDLEARSRATTVYMADRRFDMLPGILSSNLCSLFSGVDRCAVSVLWELSSRYEVLDVWYGRSVIKSAYKMFYEAAQEILDGAELEDIINKIPELKNYDKDTLKEKFHQIKISLNKLTSIATCLKVQRLDEGALELESNEVQFEFSKTVAGVKSVKPKEDLLIHGVVAECMIFANHWVAKKIYETFPQNSLLRLHPPPRQNYFQELLQCADAKGFKFNTTNNKTLASSLNAAVDESDPCINMLFRMLATQAMSVAEYFSTGSFAPEQFYHYGLGLDKYTHFTSPIRRYADVLVHRSLIAAINEDAGSHHLIGNLEVQELSEHINAKHRAAQNVQKASQQLFQNMYFRNKKSDDECCIVDVVVFALRANGVLVFVPRYGIKGPLYLRDKENQVAFYKNNSIEWTQGSLSQQSFSITVETAFGSQRYELFEHLTARIELLESRTHPSVMKLVLLKKEPLLKDMEEYSQNMSRMSPISFHKELKAEEKPPIEERSTSPVVESGIKKFYLLLEELKKLALRVPTPDEIAEERASKTRASVEVKVTLQKDEE